jgi:nucleotide-binding universal stress UspA family protein
MYHKILLCYDGSEEGRNALKEGAEVALCMNADTYLLAILRDEVAPNVPECFSETYFNGEQQAATRILREGVEWLKARNLEAHGQLVFGNPVEHIARCARKLGVDLIVVGHRHRSRLARWWSDAEDATLLDRAPCSILVSVPAAEAEVAHGPGA